MKKLLLISILLLTLSVSSLFAQGEKIPIVFSGFVVNSVNSDPVPGVHIYIPKAGRGTTTSGEGFFAIATVPGDSLILSSIGFKKHYIRIPTDKTESYSVVIELVEDTTALAVIEVFPYPTEELFKEAFLALELPDEEKLEALRRNLDPVMMTRLAFDMPMDAQMNYRNTMNQDAWRLHTQNSVPSLQLLNPFAWAKFIQSIKRGDFKKGKWKDRK